MEEQGAMYHPKIEGKITWWEPQEFFTPEELSSFAKLCEYLNSQVPTMQEAAKNLADHMAELPSMEDFE